MNLQEKTMLAHAALTYRGFGKDSEAAIERALRPLFPKLAAEGLGNWKLVWGPATFRARTSLFDDSMIYVAEEQNLSPSERPHYAIAIRGTNPVSVFDWVFGDFWVGHQVDWSPAGSPPAKLSASTALGFAIGQALAAEDPPSSTSVFAALGQNLADALQGFANTLPEIEPDALFSQPRGFKNFNLQARIAAVTDAAGDRLRAKAFARLIDLLEGTSSPVERINQHVFAGLLKQISATKGVGQTLLDFLSSGRVARGARVDVTGHSKGGALAIATALWLEETWAPGHGAEINCYSFAAPTPGNEAFAQRYNTALSKRTHRITNPRDIVPQAWVPADLENLAKHYPLLALAIRVLAKSVKKFDYMHVAGEVVEIPSSARHTNVFQELIYQHLDAYLEAAGFKEPMCWNAASLFLQR